MLPDQFADLEPFATTWCLATEPERWARRLATSLNDMQVFYDAAFPRAEEAIAYCDGFDLHALPDDARRPRSHPTLAPRALASQIHD